MTTPFPNIYTRRRVAETASKGCDICFRPTSTVLLSQSEDGKDFFYVCPIHLKDRGFCSPIVDQAEIEARKKKKALDDEVKQVVKEYEEKQKKKKEKSGKEADDAKEKSEVKDGEKSTTAEDKKVESGETKTVDEDSIKSQGVNSSTDEEPRVFALHRNFFQIRLDKRRQGEAAKRNRGRVQPQAALFPSVPKGLPGS